jgi:hypothetical protein
VHELVVPVTQAGLEFALDLALLRVLQLGEEQAELLAEGVQALPPDTVAVLVYVADEDFVEEIVDVHEHGLVMRGGEEEGRGGERGGRRGHSGGDGHCRSYGELCGGEVMWKRGLKVDRLRDALALRDGGLNVGSRV